MNEQEKELFLSYVDGGDPEKFIEIEIPTLEKLRNCDDILPADSCGQLGIDEGSTYAQAIEFIIREMGA